MQPERDGSTEARDIFNPSLYLFKRFYDASTTDTPTTDLDTVLQLHLLDNIKTLLFGPLFLPAGVTINYGEPNSITSAAQAILKSILKKQVLNENEKKQETEQAILEFIQMRIKLDMLHIYLGKENEKETPKKKFQKRIQWLQARDKKLATIKEQDSSLDFADSYDKGTALKVSGELQEVPGKSIFIDNEHRVLVGANGRGNLVCKFRDFDKATIRKTIEVLSGYTTITWRGVTSEKIQRDIEIACAKVGKRAICVGRAAFILMETMEDPNDLVGWIDRIYKKYGLYQELAKKSMQDLIQKVLGDDDEARERFIIFWDELSKLPQTPLVEEVSAIGGDNGVYLYDKL